MNNNLNNIRCNFTIEYSKQPLTPPPPPPPPPPDSSRHCSMLTGIVSYNKQPSYMNPLQ